MSTVKRLDKSWLDNVPEDKVFWCHDGRVMRNMTELAEAFKEMSEDTFQYHLNGEKNDFSTWVRDVIGDATLAGQLARVATRATATRRVHMRLDSLRALT